DGRRENTDRVRAGSSSVGVEAVGMRVTIGSLWSGDGPPGAMTSAHRAWLETIFITLLAPAIGWALDGRDPFFLQARMAWIALAPLLVGLHHGSAQALVCSLCLLVGAYAH